MFTHVERYERFMGRWSRVLAAPFLAFAGVRDGEHVLDVGTGTGVLARELVARLPAARATGVDPSAMTVASARSSSAAPRLRLAVADARALPFAAGAFDRSLASLVLNFVPDPPAALREMRRVTRRGGVVAAAVWDYGGGMEMLRLFWDAAVALDPAAEPRDERHMRLSRPGELAALWTAAGLTGVTADALAIEQRFAGFDDLWSPFLLGVGPAGALVAGLSDERRSALRASLRRRLRTRAAGDGPFPLAARAWVVRGSV